MIIAILLTCHNRKDKTISCLQALYQTNLPEGYQFDVFLVDDGSTDGTSQSVVESFPSVKLIQGTGELYWNQGMRLAWKTAVKSFDYDYYIWLNDDTIMNQMALVELLGSNKEILNETNKSSIIVASCKESEANEIFSYGGRTDSGPVVPSGELQECKYINGNLALIPKEIFHSIGYLANEYTHGMGDFDYGLRAMKKGYKNYTTKTFVATCPQNEGIPKWCNPKIKLRDRWKVFHTPLGLNIKEYNHFRQKFWGKKWMIFAIKAYLKMLVPNLYSKLA
jgi:GT2 family glycosyltransferase